MRTRLDYRRELIRGGVTVTEKVDERDALIESLRSQVEALTIDLKLLELELTNLRRQRPRPEEMR